MVYLILGAIAAFSSLVIIKDKDAFSNCLIKIKALSIAFPVFKLIPVRTVDKFSAVCSASARFRVWRNICCSNSWYWGLLQIRNS
jgi:hypothetical protein